MKTRLLALVVVAACSKGGGDEKAKDRPAPEKETEKEKVKETPVPVTVDAGQAPVVVAAPDAAPAAPAGPPKTCTVGEPVKLADASRTPGDLDLAVAGDRTAVAWFDGGKAFVVVTDPAGVPVAPAVNLGDTKETFVLATPPGFAVITITHDHCDMSGRTLDAAGVLGAPVALAKKVCNPQSYPLAAVRDGQVVVLTSFEYEAEGLTAVRWRPGTDPVVTELVDREIYAAPAAIAATDTGFAVAWHENEEDPMDLSTTKVATLDDAGVASKPTKFKDDDGVLALLGATPVQLRAKGGSVELLAGKTKQKLAPDRPDGTLALRAFAGRTWALTDALGADPTKVVPLEPDGAPASAGFDAPGNALDHDGARGAVAGWAKKTLELHALTCE